jgi:hypothetical protein
VIWHARFFDVHISMSFACLSFNHIPQDEKIDKVWDYQETARTSVIWPVREVKPSWRKLTSKICNKVANIFPVNFTVSLHKLSVHKTIVLFFNRGQSTKFWHAPRSFVLTAQTKTIEKRLKLHDVQYSSIVFWLHFLNSSSHSR